MRKSLLGFAILLGIAWPVAFAAADARVMIVNNTERHIYWKVGFSSPYRLYGSVVSVLKTGENVRVLQALIIGGVQSSQLHEVCSYKVPAGHHGDNPWTMNLVMGGGVLRCNQTAN